MLKKLVVAVIPTGVIGLTVYKAIKGYLLGNVTVVLSTLLVGGIALIVFERFQQRGRPRRRLQRDHVPEGVPHRAVPGDRRHPGRVALGRDDRRRIAARRVASARSSSSRSCSPCRRCSPRAVLELLKSRSALDGNFGVLGIGFVVSFITAIIAIKSFLGYIKKRDFSAFGWYRIVLAVVFYLVFLR